MAINLVVTIINIRSPGLTFERLPLFVWAVFITAWLLILSLPVLAGGPLIAPALKMAICWNNSMSQSAENLYYYNNIRILRDYTPEFICFTPLNLPKALVFGPYLTGLIEADGYIFVPHSHGARDSKNRLIYPSIQISFHLKN
jgi:hypothetical protein